MIRWTSAPGPACAGALRGRAPWCPRVWAMPLPAERDGHDSPLGVELALGPPPLELAAPMVRCRRGSAIRGAHRQNSALATSLSPQSRQSRTYRRLLRRLEPGALGPAANPFCFRARRRCPTPRPRDHRPARDRAFADLPREPVLCQDERAGQTPSCAVDAVKVAGNRGRSPIAAAPPPVVAE